MPTTVKWTVLRAELDTIRQFTDEDYNKSKLLTMRKDENLEEDTENWYQEHGNNSNEREDAFCGQISPIMGSRLLGSNSRHIDKVRVKDSEKRSDYPLHGLNREDNEALKTIVVTGRVAFLNTIPR